MEFGRAETGEASILDGVQIAFRRKQRAVRVDENLCIDTLSLPPRIVPRRSDFKDFTADKSNPQIVSGTPSLRDALSDVVNVKRNELQEYESRLAYLRAESADEDYSINQRSETDFWRFINSQANLRGGDLVLMENGNLRAIWENDEGAQLGLQFLGEDTVQFVAFAQRKEGQEISRVTGRDSMAGFIGLIRALGVQSLLFE